MTEVQQFHDAGWIRLSHRVDVDARQAVVEALRPTARAARPDDARILDAWRRHPAVRRVATDPGVLRTIGELFGRRPIPFQTLDFWRGTEQRLHADTIHFDSLPAGWMCGVWVALEDVGSEQGPLRLVTGSHRLPPIRPSEAVGADGRFDYSRYEDLVEQRIDGLPVEEFHAVAGDCLLWHGNLVHGGAPIRRPSSSRWSQVTHYFFEDATYITPLASDFAAGEYRVRLPLVDIGTGRAVKHRLDGRATRFVHLSSGRTRILDPAAPAPPASVRVASAVRAGTRHVSWWTSPVLERIRSPRTAHRRAA